MRHRSAIISFLAAFSVATAETKDAAKEPDQPGQSPREVAMDNLLSERDSDQALEKVIAAAKEAGIKDQAIIEARFLYHIDRREDAAIAAMLPEFLKQQELFRIEDSAIFSVKEDWLAVTEYVQAIAALKKGDKAAFKSHITEAFWLSPRQASAFAPHIDRLRLEESMSVVKIDFESNFAALGGGDAVSLTSLMKDKKALILHFWSPTSRECEASMPDFAITAKALGEKGIAVASIIPDSTPETIANARAMIQPLGARALGAWLVDDREKPLVRELRVQVMPVFVLVSNEGRVLFNGDPSDDALWDALGKLDPAITRPESAGLSE
jgi:thiol-disulfide isomerase/thioredoxin